jgi:hypothetical protein
MSVSAAAVPELTETNWVAWSTLQAAHLRQLSVWSVISEEHTTPALELLEASRNEDGTLIPLTTDQKALNIRIRLNNNAAAERFRSAREKAAGDIYVHLSQSQRAHVRGIEDDPIAMWDKLSGIHSQQVPGMHFGAYNELLSVMKQPDESLQSVAGRVSEALARVQELRPESFTIVQLDKELAIMAMLCALPCDVYGNFVSSLMREKTLTCAHRVGFPGRADRAQRAGWPPRWQRRTVHVRQALLPAQRLGQVPLLHHQGPRAGGLLQVQERVQRHHQAC